MGIWIAVVLVCAISAVLIFKVLAKRSISRGRTPLPLEDIHGTVKHNLSFGVFSEVWAVLGKPTRWTQCCSGRQIPSRRWARWIVGL